MNSTLMEVANGPRVLGVCRWGRAGGVPVIGSHGTPGCRLDAVPDLRVLRELDLDYVTYDRPGYGRSTRAEGRTVADAAADVAAIADALGLERFAVIGGSGGAPHALACAALLPGRVRAVSAVVPAGSVHEMGADAYFEGMERENAEQFRLAMDDPAALVPLLERNERERHAEDRGDPATQEAEDEAMRQGVGGVLDDVVAVHTPWGFAPRSIRVPVAVWYGTRDVHAPPAHAHWLAGVLPDARPHPQDADHTWPVHAMPDIFADLVGLTTG